MNGTESHTHDIELTIASDTPRPATAGSGVIEALKSSIPVLMGALVAVAVHAGLGLLAAQSGSRWLAALAGVSCWLYVGFALQTTPRRALASVLAAAVLFAMALLSSDRGPWPIATVFVGHALVSIVLAWTSRRDDDASSSVWLAWSAFNGSIAALSLLI